MMRNTPKQVRRTELCSWCVGADSGKRLPDAFCWTRMQAEAGQTLESIMIRKELERVLGGGTFYWGVGNAVGRGLELLAKECGKPEVLFSVMHSTPKQIDVAPRSVVMWNAAVDPNGVEHPLPEHVVVLSRGETPSGRKQRHYALVCNAAHSIEIHATDTLDIGHLENISEERGRVGFSQNTAVVRHVTQSVQSTRYTIAFRANLIYPYFVTLADPRELSSQDRTTVNAVARATTSEQWRQVVRGLKRS